MQNRYKKSVNLVKEKGDGWCGEFRGPGEDPVCQFSSRTPEEGAIQVAIQIELPMPFDTPDNVRLSGDPFLSCKSTGSDSG